MERQLFLDDERKPYDCTWQVVRSYDAFVADIEANGTPTAISFDHDLCFEHYPFNETNPVADKIPYEKYKEKTGYHAVQWLIATGRIKDVQHAIVHTMNPIGRTNMLTLLVRAGVRRIHCVKWQNGQAWLIPVKAYYKEA
jgi:hypothetical protein